MSSQQNDSSYQTVKFPYENGHYEYLGTYLAEDVDDWFKRCINDFPEIIELDDKLKIYPVKNMYIKWFNKWFTQFDSSHTTVNQEEE